MNFAASLTQRLSRNELRVFDATPPPGSPPATAEDIARDAGFRLPLTIHLLLALDVMSRDVVESVEGYAANRRVVSVVVVEVEPAGQRQASFGL